MHIHQIIGTSHWFSKMDTCTKHTTHGSCHSLTLEPLPLFTQAAMQLPNLVLISSHGLMTKLCPFLKFSFGGVDQFLVSLVFLLSFLLLFWQGKVWHLLSKMHIHQIIGTSHWFSKMDTCTKHTTHGPCHILTLEPLPLFTQAAMQLPNLVLISSHGLMTKLCHFFKFSFGGVDQFLVNLVFSCHV